MKSYRQLAAMAIIYCVCHDLDHNLDTTRHNFNDTLGTRKAQIDHNFNKLNQA